MPYGYDHWGSTKIRYNVPNSELFPGAAAPGATGPYTAQNTPMPLTKPITYQAPQKQTLQDNVGAFPDIEKLSQMINSLQQAAQQRANAGRIPGASDLEAQSSQNIGSYLRGEVPADVKYNIAKAAAERGVATGNVYGANTNANYLRSLGLESVGLMNKGQDQLTQAYARNPSAPLFDPSTLLITPKDREELRLKEEQLRLEAERVAALQQEAATRQFAAFNQTVPGYSGINRTSYPSRNTGWQPGQMLVPPGYFGGYSGSAPTQGNDINWGNVIGGSGMLANPNAVAKTGSTPQEEYDLDTIFNGYDVNNRIV